MQIDPWSLGATLYVPATRDDLFAVASGARLPDLRSAVFCLEDSLRDEDVAAGLANLRALLGRLRRYGAASGAGPLLFVRPRDADMLRGLCLMPGIERIHGFVLPKTTAESLPEALAAGLAAHHLLMPTIETREAFDPEAMRRLREQLLAVRERILAVRIGGNDLLQTMGVRRSPVRTAYEGPLGPVIASLVATFAPWGFALSAPVFENFGDAALLRAEVERDLEHGLSSKTAIHPRQIATIHAGLQVDAGEIAAARAVLAEDARAAFGTAGIMHEPATHRRWAQALLARAEHFGVRAPASGLSLVG